jgi:hypothetical protein
MVIDGFKMEIQAHFLKNILMSIGYVLLEMKYHRVINNRRMVHIFR